MPFRRLEVHFLLLTLPFDRFKALLQTLYALQVVVESPTKRNCKVITIGSHYLLPMLLLISKGAKRIFEENIEAVELNLLVHLINRV